MSREWLAVSSFTDTIRLFATAKSSSRTRNRQCHCYTVGAMGRVDPSCFTLRYRTSISRPSAIAFPVTPFVHAACYFFLPLSEHASHPDNARHVPFSTTTRTKAAVDAALYRCYPTASNSIRRHEPPPSRGGWKGREEGEKGRKKRDRDGVVRGADRWGVKPPIKRPLVSARRTGDISISNIGLKLLVTSRVFREQRGMDREGRSREERKAGVF